ncbi:MAG: DUF2142 domain-containing protein, partial [Acidobacteriota bacterium]
AFHRAIEHIRMMTVNWGKWLRPHPLLALLLLAFILLATIYSVATPIFEAGDEIWHFPFVQHLATGHSLPVQDPAVKTLWEQEGGQPPLYYALGALATFWIDTGDLSDRRWMNPEAKIGIPLAYGNKNLIVHTSAEDFPWHNTALAVHLLRFLSILLSAGTVALTYFLALEIKAGDKTLAALAAACVAFNPMFLFISASVNNDNLAVMLATLAMLLLVRLITRGPTPARLAVLGVVLGLAALSKASNLGLLILAAIVFLYLILRNSQSLYDIKENNRGTVGAPLVGARSGRVGARSGRPRGSPLLHIDFGSLIGRFRSTLPLLASCFLCAAIVVVIAGWWYARNWLLYGDPLAFNVWVAIAGGRPAPATLTGLLGEFQGFRISFWGNFGGVNVIAPDWVYTVLDIVTFLSAAGLLIGIIRRTLPRLLALPAVWLALICASLVRWTLLTLASQGRLIFPAISAVAILLVYGLEQLRIGNWQLTYPPAPFLQERGADAPFPKGKGGGGLGWMAPCVPMRVLPLVVFLFVFAALAPFTLIAPAYALPQRLPADASVPHPTHITFENAAELVGYAMEQNSVRPGEELPLTLYWRAQSRMAEDYSVSVRVFDGAGNIVGRWNAFPGQGLYPTRAWQPGEIVVDSYRVPVALDAQGPGAGRVEVGLFRRLPLENLTARDPQGNTITPTIARVKIAGASLVQVQNPIRRDFGGKISLVGYQIENSGDTLQVSLYWRALAALNEDYTVFVHLVDAQGNILAQKDDPPQQGAYPTSFWDVGETVKDEHLLPLRGDVAAGDYRIEIGWYRAADLTRLPLDGGGDTVVLEWRASR